MSQLNGDEIVISGISGLFSNAENVYQLKEKLYNKVDMVSKQNIYSHIKNPEFPHYVGHAEGMEHFDSQFFKITSKQARYMDPVMGKLLEHSFSALFDAGMNPDKVSPNLGVYVACGQIDSVNFMFSDIHASSFVISGGSKCMLANRVSYWMDGKGPSYNLDCGYAGSMSALEFAYNAMKKNEIDCAIVGGCNYCFKPELTLNMKRAGLLCLDGKTKCFDKNGDGFVRSDAINVYFLQKAKDAKRIYAEVKYVKGKYFASPDGLFTPNRNPEDIEMFLKEFYSEVNLNPYAVEYLETNSFGIAASDENELEAVGNVFAYNRKVKIGSIKSNMGNTECASGASSIIKLCLAYQSGQIPANLHYNEPQTQIAAVREKRLQVVTENEPFNRNYTAVNNFCFTGNNFHALLKGHYTPKDQNRYKAMIPRLVLVASRNEEGVTNMLNILESNPIDPEQLALLNNFFKHGISGFTGRGYTILDSYEENKTFSLTRSFEYFSGKSRPVWFLYSGMGSQWAGMGEGLLKIPIFANAIQRCSNILEKKGLNLLDIITNKDSTQLNILKSLMAITAIQIGLTDVLKSIGVFPDNIIGHSVGEIACAYGDGSLTADEAILTSYARAIATYETKFIKGTMAAVGLGYNEVKHLCPPEIEVACHNSNESATIAGPSEAVNVFIKTLTDRGIFAKEVDSYDIAFHSKYINEAGPRMLKLLKEVIKNPKPRSKKWLSTCYLPEDWHIPESQYASAEYFAHNLMNSVLLEESASYIAEDAIIIEIAPHGLLQAIMKRSHTECINIPLTKRGETDGAKFLLNSLGKLHQTGLNLDLEPVYPKVEFPVSTETPLLSHLVTWPNETHWKFNAGCGKIETSIVKEIVFSLHDDEFNFLRDYNQNGKLVIPEAALLVFTWETLAISIKKKYKDVSVIFENVTFYDQICIQENEIARFEITIQKGSNIFEILYKNKIAVIGKIYFTKSSDQKINQVDFNDNEKLLTQNNVYTLLRARGYNYGSRFKSILSMNLKMNKAAVIYSEEWISLLDSILQIKTLSENCRGLSRIKYINKVTIDTQMHKLIFSPMNGAKCFYVMLDNATETIVGGGIKFNDIVLINISNFESKWHIEKDLNIDINSQINPTINGKNGFMSHVLVAEEQDNVESLTWVGTSVMRNKTTVQVYYSGLSSKDCNKLSSLDDPSFGMDYSGFDNRGKRVMGLVPCGAVASTIEADPDLLWPVPRHWSLAEAATVPLPYVHAFYCLTMKHSLAENKTILVIGAAGALGQAVISMAIHMKCTIFATVGNAAKKIFLLKLFPELNENHIGYTYDGTFYAMVSDKTKGKKCNIVINTSSGQIREEAMKCVGDRVCYNTFIDVNDSDIRDNKEFRMGFIGGDRSYKAVNMSTIFDEDFKQYKKVIYNKVIDGISKGFVRPLTSITYAPWEITKAFQLLSERRNRGRALISLKQFKLNSHISKQIPRIRLYSTYTYMVVCDGSELGIELVDFLVLRGARKIIIHCHPNVINGYFLAKFSTWKNCGVNVELISDDLRIEKSCDTIFKRLLRSGDVDGIFVTWSNYEIVNNETCQAVKDLVLILCNLDIKSRVCKDLRYFAILTATHTFEKDSGIKEIQTCCSRRKELGLPSLHLHFSLGGKIWDSTALSTVFLKLEKSIIFKLLTVCVSLQDNHERNAEDTNNTKFDAGLHAFCQYTLLNELEALEPVIQMKTKECTVIKNDLNIDPEKEYAIMIPGIDGNIKCFEPIAERLKKPVIALQMETDLSDSISEVAKKYILLVKKRYRIKSPYYIFGYSFGVNIALEMANMLEKEGLVGVVYCLDSSPDALRGHLDAYLGHLSEQQLQNALLEHMYKLFCGKTYTRLAANIRKAASWTEKIEVFVNEIKTEVNFSHEFMKNVLESAHRKFKFARSYKPNFILNSQLVLMKGIPHPNAQCLTNDYNLSSYSNKPVQVFNIKSDHATALADCRISNYVNRILKLC